MCGIIGYIGSQDPKGILLDGLKRLEYRGYDSAGIAVVEKGKTNVYRSEGRLQQLEQKLGGRKFDATLGVGHTRWATHGAPTETNAHPHQVGAITLVHNGIIENYLEHKNRLLADGRYVSSDTDSEIVAHLFDIEISKGKSLKDAVLSVLPQLKGSYAFVILNEKEPDVMVGVRNGAPLLVGLGEKENFLASDVQAILHRTKQMQYLEDHQFALCTRNGVEIFTERGQSVSLPVKTIQWTPDQMDKLGYRHFMLKEIHEQGRAITQTIEGNIDHTRGVVSLADLTQALPYLRKVNRIALVACGTARHAALVGKDYIERFTGVPVEVDFGSEFRYREPLLDPNTLLICVSQSGETADTLAAMREGKACGVPTLSICNVRDSTLARESDFVLYTNAGPEIGVASTKAFTTQLTLLYMFAVQFGTLKGFLPEEFAVELTADLLHLPFLVEQTLESASEVEKIAVEHQKNSFFFYMGRGTLYPIALEGALKLKEISYLHAEGYPAGELKHGPIALIDRDVVVIVLSPKDRPHRRDPTKRLSKISETLYEKTMSNLQEVKSRGGRIWTIGTSSDSKGEIAKASHFFSGVPETTWALNPILVTIPTQIFAYYVALQKGTDVDKPRNLAKSVTVE